MKLTPLILAPIALVYAAATVTANVDVPDAPISAEHFETPASNTADEPMAQTFSLDQAVQFADNAAMDWQDTRRCVTCHTNGLFLLARPAVGVEAAAYRDARDFTEGYLARYVDEGQAPRGQHGSIEGLVATTAFKTISDIRTTGQLETVTTQALDYIWSRQDESGAWEQWLKCNWGPYEADNHFGVTLVALAMGVAQEDPYTQSPVAQAGVKALLDYLESHPPENLHQTGMTLWASMHLDGIADDTARQQWVEELLAAQQNDGGWVLNDLGGGQWEREDGGNQDTQSDAYATAFVAYVLIESGLSRNDEPVARAIAWLEENQRESGRWYTRSPRRDRSHFISHAATNFALMVLSDPETQAQDAEP